MIHSRQQRNRKKRRGFGLIEVIIASAIISASLIALTSVIQISFRATSETFKKSKAEFLAEEGLEVVIILRNDSWLSQISSLATSTSYYPLFSTTTSSWSLSTTVPSLIYGRYSRSVTINEVYRRDLDDDIVASTSPDANTLDTGTVQVISSVSWEGDKSLQFVTYITDLFGN